MLMFTTNNLVVGRQSESLENPLSCLMGGILKPEEPIFIVNRYKLSPDFC